jgi:hypothetical protein
VRGIHTTDFLNPTPFRRGTQRRFAVPSRNERECLGLMRWHLSADESHTIKRGDAMNKKKKHIISRSHSSYRRITPGDVSIVDKSSQIVSSPENQNLERRLI